MEEPLLPLPAWRFDCRRDPEDRTLSWRSSLKQSFSEFELPRIVKVHSPVLGACKCVLTIFYFVAYVLVQLWMNKSYLAMAPIEGIGRFQLQHPVAMCNPLMPECVTRYRGFDELPYCVQHKGSVGPDVAVRETCEYYDGFDLEYLKAQQAKILVPTRVSNYKQKLVCTERKRYCPDGRKYDVEHLETVFVADIESFTLLVDHSFICEELGISDTAWKMIGFYSPCLYGVEDEEHDAAKLLEGREAEKECELEPIPIHNMFFDRSPFRDKQGQLNRTRNMWTETNYLRDLFPMLQGKHGFLGSPTEDNFTGVPFYKRPEGDVIRIGDILKSLDIHLDESLGEGKFVDNLKGESRGNKTYRSEGFVLEIEIRYHNFKYFSWPNVLPSIYTYHFKLAPRGEYKVMAALQSVPGEAEHERYIDDRHGIYVVLKQTGIMGRLRIEELRSMFLEFVVIYGLLSWVINIVAFNYWAGEAGDAFEEEAIQDVEFSPDDVGTIRMAYVERRSSFREPGSAEGLRQRSGTPGQRATP